MLGMIVSPPPVHNESPLPPPILTQALPSTLPTLFPGADSGLVNEKGEPPHIPVFGQWYHSAVASYLKEELKTLYPELEDSDQWRKPGLHIPVRSVDFVPDEQNPEKVHLVVRGIFFDVLSSSSFSFSELSSLAHLQATFEKSIESDKGVVELSVDMHFQLDPTKKYLLIHEISGKISASNPPFKQQDRFKVGPWHAPVEKFPPTP
jgi:hypothetical protein